MRKDTVVKLLHCKELRITADDLCFTLLSFLNIREINKITDYFEEAFRLKSPLDKRLHFAESCGGILLIFNLLPCVVMLEWCIGCAELRGASVAENRQQTELHERRDIALVADMNLLPSIKD